ncbi:trypsin-like cysteine/serine peptidase domain-containing protein, partial [Podospora fimiseda]
SEQFILTAGHNLVNENGRAHRVEIIYGIDHPLQTRSGVDAVVHGSYYLEGRLINDIAIIRLNKSFIGVTPLQFRQTPITGNGAATVYGYPKDTPRFRPNGKLCVSGPSRMEYNPSLREGFIGHHSNTERGSSGGPIVDSSNTVIGVHTQGLSTINLGVPINRRGNDPKPLLRMLDYMGSHDARVPPVTIIGPVGNVGYEGVLFTW